MLRSAAFSGQLPAGDYLFGGQPSAAGKPQIELQFDLEKLLAKLPRASNGHSSNAHFSNGG